MSLYDEVVETIDCNQFWRACNLTNCIEKRRGLLMSLLFEFLARQGVRLVGTKDMFVLHHMVPTTWI